MRKEVVAIVLIVLISAMVLWFFPKVKSVREEDARVFVTEHLRTEFPLANDISIMNSHIESKEDGDYFVIKASVVEKANSPCPELWHYYYDVPSSNFQNFVTRPPEFVTYDCKVCEDDGSSCVIAYQPQAIIASHSYSGTEVVRDFLLKYTDAVPQVQFVPVMGEEKEVWIVSWTAKESSFGYRVLLSKNKNSVINIEKFDVSTGS